jgi:hypothetical protein
MSMVPKEFFTLQSMLTLSGATGATFVICNGLQTAFNFNPRWLALAVAQLIVLIGTHLSGGSGVDYFIAVINGFLVFCTAAGATHAASGGSGQAIARSAGDAANPQPGRVRRRFLSPWF